MTQLSLFGGQARKEIGQDQVLRNTSDSWKEVACDIILGLSHTRNEFTSDDFRELIQTPDNPNAIGAVFSSMSKQGHIRKTGRYIQSKIPSCQGRIIAIWEGHRK